MNDFMTLLRPRSSSHSIDLSRTFRRDSRSSRQEEDCYVRVSWLSLSFRHQIVTSTLIPCTVIAINAHQFLFQATSSNPVASPTRLERSGFLLIAWSTAQRTRPPTRSSTPPLLPLTSGQWDPRCSSPPHRQSDPVPGVAEGSRALRLGSASPEPPRAVVWGRELVEAVNLSGRGNEPRALIARMMG